jgi:hypothetical protein
LRCQKAMAIRIARLADPWSLRHLHVCTRHARDLPAPSRRLADYLIRHDKNEL